MLVGLEAVAAHIGGVAPPHQVLVLQAQQAQQAQQGEWGML